MGKKQFKTSNQKISNEKESNQNKKIIIKVKEDKQANKPSNNTKIDNRFAKAEYDPKFMRPKQDMTKVTIDSRFSKMLSDPAFQSHSKVDKYGRKIIDNGQNKQLKQLYVQEKQQKQTKRQNMKSITKQFKKKQKIIKKKIQQNTQQVENESMQSQEQESQKFDKINEDGSTNIRKWMEEYDEQSSQNLEDMPVEQILQQQQEGSQVWSDNQDVIKNENVQATPRLALCNFDWMNLNAKDLMIVFNSFKPNTGYVKSIKVYMSNLGKQKLETEELYGPQGIWNEQQQQQQDEEQRQKAKWKKSWKELLNRDQQSAINERKLRAYQKQRLKYFYAIIECDSKKTADQIYKECDGNQFQTSNLQFDLRFVPDDTKFEKTMLRDQCNEVPVNGEVKNFISRALGHSKVQLTWQDPELSLPASLKKKNWNKLSQEQFNKIDWNAYLNQDEMEEQDNRREVFGGKNKQQDEDHQEQKLNLPDWKIECDKSARRKNQKQKLVVSFGSGFDKPIKNQHMQQPLSLKKQKKSKKELWKRAQDQKQKRKQNLQLLVDQNQKQKNFQLNLQDNRFKAVFQNPAFSIDPVDPKFDHRRSGNVFKEIVQRNKIKNLL